MTVTLFALAACPGPAITDGGADARPPTDTPRPDTTVMPEAGPDATPPPDTTPPPDVTPPPPDAPPDGPPMCAAGETLCDGTCVNTATSSMHCGMCNRPCAAGEMCEMGACRPSVMCPAGQTNCGGACVNTQLDLANCGMCARACAMGETCAMGTCRAAMMCPAGQTDCGGMCVDTATSTAHCGSCGRACAAGEACTAGACAPVMCPAGQMRCGAACVDTQTDAANCGMCGRACAMGEVCMAGACAPACPAPRTECSSGMMMTVCTDTQTDNANCGMCGRACAGGRTCMAGMCQCATGSMDCGGTCVDTQNDNANCGACGRACPSGQVCRMGACDCAAPLTRCTGAGGAPICTLTSIDALNCGRCGNVCPAAMPACIAGACSASTCTTGRIRCPPTGGTGVCVDPQTDNNNCGGCGTVCGASRSCVGGVCRPANDLRANAATIAFGAGETTVAGTTTNALRDGPAVPCGCTSGGNVWYRFTLARREVVYFDTAGAGTTYDTSLFLTDSAGTPVPGQATAGFPNAGLCNDDSGCGTTGGFTNNLQSRLAGVLAAGTYYLSVSGCGTGNFVLHAQHLPDNIGSFFYADRLNGTATTPSTVLVGTSAATGTCGGTASGEDVRWLLTCGAQQFFSMCLSDGGTFTRRIGTTNYDPSMYIRSAQTGAQVVCNDDGPSMGGSICWGTGGDMLQYGSRINNAMVPRGVAAVFVDERTGGSGMRYQIRYTTR